jgi:hypothetical protein
MWVFEKRVLSGIFRCKRGEVTGGLRKVHNEELHILYASHKILLRWVETVSVELWPLMGSLSVPQMIHE